jgi:hypothetical protein
LAKKSRRETLQGFGRNAATFRGETLQRFARDFFVKSARKFFKSARKNFKSLFIKTKCVEAHREAFDCSTKTGLRCPIFKNITLVCVVFHVFLLHLPSQSAIVLICTTEAGGTLTCQFSGQLVVVQGVEKHLLKQKVVRILRI